MRATDSRNHNDDFYAKVAVLKSGVTQGDGLSPLAYSIRTMSTNSTGFHFLKKEMVSFSMDPSIMKK